MDVSYRKDLHNNYLVVPKLEDDKDEAYCVRMLQANPIVGILKPDQRTIDNQVQFYYDITSKQSLEILYVKTSINYDQIKKIFLDLADIIERTYEYLLNENDLVLMPEHIYIELSSGQVNVCYLPGYDKDLRKQISNLIEYMMNKVEYQAKDAVLYVYNLYSICREESCSFNDLLNAIREENLSKPVKEEKRKSLPLELNEKDKPEVVLEEKNPISQIPVMMEKISNDQEQYYYPVKIYIYTGICCFLAIIITYICFKTKIIYTPLGNRIDYGKLMALMLILLCVVGYLMKKVWDKKNRLTKIICKEEYVDPREENIDRGLITKQVSISEPIAYKERLEQAPNPTVLLNLNPKSLGCYLKAKSKDIHEDIHIKEFPFIIGKQKDNVDYCLNNEIVSRYHIKLTKDDEKYYITDLNSTNGTCLNEISLPCYQRYELKDGDEISIAGIKYQFQINV